MYLTSKYFFRQDFRISGLGFKVQGARFRGLYLNHFGERIKDFVAVRRVCFTTSVKRDPHKCQKRPTKVSKETNHRRTMIEVQNEKCHRMGLFFCVVFLAVQ
jgi:hypothetical protein